MNHHPTNADSRRFDSKRADLRRSLERDVARRERREEGRRSFWRSLGVLGMVGWPIALGAAGGALLGRHLDTMSGSGIRYTLMLLTLGVAAGSFAAWNAVTHKSN